MAMYMNGNARVGDPNAVRTGEQIIAEQRDAALARAEKAEAEASSIIQFVDKIAASDPYARFDGYDEHCAFCWCVKGEHSDECPWVEARKIVEKRHEGQGE